MSATVDSRVVEMRFDNKEFEANAKETLNTLKQLKEALNENITADTFENLNRAVRNTDLSGLQAGIEALTDRFSTFGVVSMSAINKVVDVISDKLLGAIHAVDDAILGGGLRRAQNIENAKFQLEGILNDTDKVTEAMKDASAAVDGTAFSLDSAAKAASMFVASGVNVGDDLTQALTAISGVAATANSSYEDMARIFTTVAGNGRLMGDQLLQLSVRGLNAAATLKNYFNGVADNSITASESVEKLVKNLMGMSDAIGQSTEERIKSAQKSVDLEYNTRKKVYDQEYKDLQKKLNLEYEAKRKSYDESYKLLQKSLNDELAALQKANNERLQQVQNSYQSDVEAYKKATEKKIELINKEYTESIKLIDEERYNKIKAIDDKIKKINEEAEAEQKARELEQEEAQRTLLKKAVEEAKFTQTREKAEKALAEFEKEVARKRLSEQRQDNIKDLNEQKEKINEEANLKKEEAAKKRENALKAVQEESQAKLEAMAKAHEAEMAALREQQQAAVEAMREANAEKLANVREQQQAELSLIKERQQSELELKRETQSEDLKEFKENLNEKLEALKIAIKEENGVAAKFGNGLEVTEADIRDMVSKGLISFELFSEAMATTFGDHAYNANKTFSGAMDNIKSALARTGALFYTPFLESGDNNPAIKFLNAIRVEVNQFNKILTPIADTFTKFVISLIPALTSKLEKLNLVTETTLVGINKTAVTITPLGRTVTSVLRTIGNILLALASYVKPVTEAFKEIFSIDMSSMQKGAEGLEKFTEGLKLSDETGQKVKSVFKGIFSIFKGLGAVLKAVFRILSPLTRLFGAATSATSSLSDNIVNLVDSFVKWLETSTAINSAISFMSNLVGSFVQKVKDLANAINREMKSVFSGSRSIGSYFSEGFLKGMMSLVPDIIKSIFEFGKAVLKAVCDVFKIASPSKEMYALGEYTMEGFGKALIDGMSSIVDIVLDIFKTVIITVKEFLTSINWTDAINAAVSGAVNFIESFTNAIVHGIPSVIAGVGSLFGAIKAETDKDDTGKESGKNFVITFINGMAEIVAKLASSVVRIFDTLFSEAKKALKNFSIKDAWSAGVSFAINVSLGIITTMRKWMGPVMDALTEIFEKFKIEGTLAAAAGVGAIILIVRAAQLLNRATNPFEGFARVFTSFSKTLNAATADFRANAILKLSAAVAILVGSIVILYQTFSNEVDPKKFFIVMGIMAAILTALAGIFAMIGSMEPKSKVAVSAVDRFINQASLAIQQISIGVKNFLSRLGTAAVFKAFGDMMLEIMLSMVVISAAYQKDENAIRNAGLFMLKVAAAVSVMIAAFLIIASKMKEAESANVKNVMLGVLALGGALYLMTKAVEDIVNINIDFKRDKDSLLLLGGLLLVLCGLVAMVSKTSRSAEEGYNVLKMGFVIGFCVLLLASLVALKKLIKMGATLRKNKSQLLMLASIFAILIVVVAALRKLSQYTGGKKKLSGLGVSLIGLCSMLLVTVATIGILSKMKISSFIKGLLMTVSLFGALLLVCKAAAMVQSNGGYKSIMAIGVVVGVLLIAVGMMSMIETSRMLAASAGLYAVLASFAATLYAAGTISDKSSYISIISMIFAIGAIAAALKWLSDIPWQQLLAVAGSISTVMLAMGVAMKDVSSIKDTAETMAGNVIYITEGLLTVWLIAIILKHLSDGVQWDSLLGLAGGISAVMLTMPKMLKDVSSIKIEAENVVHAGELIIAGLFVVAALAVILNYFSKDIESVDVVALAASISASMLAMAGAMRIIVNSNLAGFSANIGASIGVILEGLGSMWLIARELIRYAQNDYEPDKIISLAIGVSIALLAMAAMTNLAAALGPVAKEALMGMVAIGACGVLVEGIIGIMGLIYDDPRIRKYVEDGGRFLFLFAEIIGRFIGILVKNVINTASESLPTIAMNLNNFMVYAEPFFDALRKIDDNTMNKAKMVVGALGVFATASFLDACTRILNSPLVRYGIGLGGGSSLTAFITQLGNIGTALADFDTATKNISNVDRLSKVIDCLKSLMTAAKSIPQNSEWSFAEFFGGKKDIGKFGEQLLVFSSYIGTIATRFAHISQSELDKFKPVASATMEMITTSVASPGQGTSLYSLLTGKKDIGTFGQQLLSFSSVIGTIATRFAHISQSQLDKFKPLATAMADVITMSASVPGSGTASGGSSFYDVIMGRKDIGVFGQQLLTFSSSIVAVCNNIKLVSIKSLDKLKDILPPIIEFVSVAGESFSKYESIRSNLEKVMEDVKYYSESVRSIAEDVSTGPGLYLNRVFNSVDNIVEIVKKFKENFSEKIGNLHMKSTMRVIKSYAKKLLEIINISSTISPDSVSNLLTSVYRVAAIKSNFDKNFSTFLYDSEGLKTFMRDIQLYSALIKPISDSSSNLPDNVNESIIKLQNTLSAVSSFKRTLESKFKGKYTASHVQEFMQDLKAYTSALSTLTYISDNVFLTLEKLKTSREAILSIKTTLTNLKSYRSKNIQEFLADLNKFALSLANIKNFTEGITALSVVNIDAVVYDLTALSVATKNFIGLIPSLSRINGTNLTNFLTDLKKHGATGVKDFLAAFNNAQPDVVKAVATMFSYIQTEFNSRRNLLISIGKMVTGYIADGMKTTESLNKVGAAITTMMKTISTSINNQKRTEIYRSGANIVQGLVNGIEGNLQKAYNAGKRLAEAVIEAARRALNERSPSKEMSKIGSFAGEGFVNGLSDWISAASRTGTQLCNTTMDTMRDVISKVGEEIQNEDIFDPTITPILDLSNIEKNANLIGSMLNMDRPIQLATNAGITFSGGLNNLLENIQASIPDNTNDDVVEAINGLREDMNIMNDRINNLQVVMDSGELVGVLAEPIDAQLGFNAVLSERGVR